MSRSFLALLLVALLIPPPSWAEDASSSGPPSAPEGFVWKVLPEYSDEFDGTELSLDKWKPNMSSSWKGREPSHFSTENVSVSDGNLVLRTTSRVDDVSTVANPEKDVWINAACVSSRKKTAFYGYYEARVKASELSTTSSFWFQGSKTEIDVAEQVGASSKETGSEPIMMMATHYFPHGFADDKSTSHRWTMPTKSAEGFHTYGIWWKDANTVWFYHDGVKTAEVRPAGDFTEPMYMYFDTEVFLWEGLPLIESLKDPAKNAMRVDWVRAWTLEKTPEASAVQPTP